MQKLLAAFFLLYLFYAKSILAQEFKTGTVEFNGVKYPAYVKEVDASVDQANNAIKQIMDSRNAKAKNFKGFSIYRNIVLPNTGNNDRHDLFVHVEPVGKKVNNRSKISMIITKPDAIKEDKPSKEEKGKMAPVVLAAGGAYILTEVTPAIENQVYLKSILDQEELVKKTEKKMNDLREDSLKMEKQLLKLQTDKENNRTALETMVAELEAAQAELLRRKAAKPRN
jgi:altronate dehydratase